MAVIKDVEVSFCSVTNEDGHKNGKHLIGVYVDKKFKKKFVADFETVWADNKTAKARKPKYSTDEWFSEDEDDGRLIFWVNKSANSDIPIDFKRATGTKFTGSDFEIIGKGSVIDLEYSLYYHNHPQYGEMVLRAIKGIMLKELVPYEGGSELDGETMEVGKSKKSKKESSDDEYKDFEDTDDEVSDEKPKKKKKKKKNK